MTPGTATTRSRRVAVAGALLLQRALRAQLVKRSRIALLSLVLPIHGQLVPGAFRQGLSALGYGDEDIEIEERYADGHAERLPDLAADLVRLAPEVIVTNGPAV